MNNSKNNSLKMLNNEQLLYGLEKLVHSERKLMHIILAYIHEVEIRRLHLDMGYESIFKFLTVHHGYSEDAAYARMHGARMLAKVPALQEKLEQGSISLSQLSKVCSAIRAEKKAGNIVSDQQTIDLLGKIEDKNLFETRKTIAVELNQPVIQTQTIRPQSDESFVIQATLSQARYEAFRKAQSLISHSVPDNSIADAIEHLSKFLIKKVEGKSSAQGTEPKRESSANDNGEESYQQATHGFRLTKKRRRYISVKIKRQLMKESGEKCSFEHPESGITCDSDFQLQADHIIPVSEGGSDKISNLRIMCAIHNRDRSRVRHRSRLETALKRATT